jgi:hypothetical protein
MSNLLALPLVQLSIETGNNEDWIDAIKYVAVAEGVLPEDPAAPQVDLRGILFEMEIRRNADDREVIISASTADGTLSVGAPPNYGYLIFFIQYDTMEHVPPGSYVGDVIGRDEEFVRKFIQMDLTVVEGITKWPSPA